MLFDFMMTIFLFTHTLMDGATYMANNKIKGNHMKDMVLYIL